MVKRETKRKARKIFSIFAIAIGAIIALVAVVLISKAILPLLSFGGSSDKLIRPVGEMTTLDGLQKRLSDKNIYFESLKESSISGNFEGEIKEGPKVLFSPTQDAKWQVSSLALILQRTRINHKEPALIDLTNNRPIVKF